MKGLMVDIPMRKEGGLVQERGVMWVSGWLDYKMNVETAHKKNLTKLEPDLEPCILFA